MTPKEALDWVENVFEEHRVQLPDVELTLIREALNELERLKKFKATFDNYELAKKQDFIAYENWQECERELTELKHNVKRYFELANNVEMTEEVLDEFSEIRDKLLNGDEADD